MTIDNLIVFKIEQKPLRKLSFKHHWNVRKTIKKQNKNRKTFMADYK